MGRWNGTLLLLILIVGSTIRCTETIHVTEYIDTLITGNNPPPFDDISYAQQITYINRIYVDLLGREPTAQELTHGLAVLAPDPKHPAVRDSLIAPLTRSRPYYRRLFDLACSDFINGTDSSTMQLYYQLFELLWFLDSLNGNTQYELFYRLEQERLLGLLHAVDDYHTGAADVHEFYRRMLLNYFYDQVNMGSENFVRASFEDLFLRTPTAAELASGVAMVDNIPSSIFLQVGNSKGDFATIVTRCDDFYEGLVMKTYQQLLARKPIAQESAAGIQLLKSTYNLPLLYRQIMISYEYADF